MAKGRRKAERPRGGRVRAAIVPGPCPDCGTRMAPALSGLRCPRFGACGRGGVEETVDRLPRARREAYDARPRGSVET